MGWDFVKGGSKWQYIYISMVASLQSVISGSTFAYQWWLVLKVLLVAVYLQISGGLCTNGNSDGQFLRNSIVVCIGARPWGVGVALSTINMQRSWKQWLAEDFMKRSLMDKFSISNLIKDIKERGAKFRSLQFRIVPREANVTTHGLAMEGRKYGYPMYWVEEVLKEVERLVDKDRRGVG
ncbi:hypothetical protein Gohar_002770, partial [Gossypium harknessii]|nr:hypothetical protein [Gossypium harknessii]